MSRSVDLFIGSSLPLGELAGVLRQRTNAQLVPTTDLDRWLFIDGEVTAELSEHPYVDDGELWLSRYRYVLSTRMAAGVAPLDSAAVLSLRHAAQILHDPATFPVLLVLDLQYRIEPTHPEGDQPNELDDDEVDDDEVGDQVDGPGDTVPSAGGPEDDLAIAVEGAG